MNELKKYGFSDLYEMSSGISSKPEQAGHGHPFVSFSTVFNNQFLPDALPDLMDTSEKERETYSVKEGDIFLTRTSETLDELGMSSVAVSDFKNATYSGFLKRLRPTQDDLSYHKYMAFYLRSKLFRKTMNNNAIMTLRASLNEQIFSYIDLLLPEYEEQKKIGDYLYLINQKIELNNKINAELEVMAKLIYDYWFVQFDFPDANGKPYKSSGGKMVYNETLKREIPDGWIDGNVLQVSDLLGGGTPSKENPSFWGGSIPFFTPTDTDGNVYSFTTEDYITQDGLKGSSTKLFEENTVFITARGSVGRLALNAVPMAMNQSCYAFKAKSDFSYSYLFFLIKELIHHLEVKATGSVFNSIVSNDIEWTNLALPSNEAVVKKYAQAVEPLFKRIKLSTEENLELANLRDWLLPMLMNGQVTVKGS